MYKIYLDDIRTPVDSLGNPDLSWKVVRNYNQFTDFIDEVGLDSVDYISLDHDLGYTAMQEYFRNVKTNYRIDYQNIKEKTGYDVAKWLVEYCLDNEVSMPKITVHSANPIGSANIMGYINNYLMNCKKPQTCVRTIIPFKS